MYAKERERKVKSRTISPPMDPEARPNSYNLESVV